MTILIIRRAFAPLLAAFIVLGLANAVQAQDFPTKPIRLVSPYQPGGSTDLALNLFRDRLMQKWGQPVLVEYRPGAAALIGMEMVFRAPPDGYTLLVMPTSPVTAAKHLFSKLRFDPDQFIAITMISETPNVLVVHPNVPVKTFKDLIDYARANPNKLNYASTSDGGASHLATELLQTMTNTKVNKIPFNGVGPSMTALLGGHIDMTFTLLSVALPHIKAGKLRVLAVGSEKRSPFLPGDIPAIAETLPGFISLNVAGVFAPPGTPAPIITKLHGALAEILKDPPVTKRYYDISAVTLGGTPTESAEFVRKEGEVTGKIIRQLGIKLD